MLLWNLMSSQPQEGDWVTWVFMGAIVLGGVVMFLLSGRSQKKRQQEMQETLNALKPGCKVKTIGGICGVVVEICNEDNTFVMETGSEEFGKSYIKFDKQAIYQTDAKKEAAPAEEAPIEAEKETVAPADETPVFEEESVAPVIAAEAIAEKSAEPAEPTESVEEPVETEESAE